jgi:hypothetical protein
VNLNVGERKREGGRGEGEGGVREIDLLDSL